MAHRIRIKLPRWVHFVIPFVLTGLVVSLRYGLSPILQESGPFFLAALVVTISAFIGGLWPGLVATCITTLSGLYLFMPGTPLHTISDPRLRIMTLAQLTVGLCISLICGALRSSEAVAAQSAEQERESRDKLDALFQSITDKLLTVSKDLKLLSFNQAAANRWSIRPEMIGEHLSKILPKAIVDGLDTPINRAIKIGQAISIEIHDDESGQTYEVRSFPSPEGLLVYFHNISERIRINDEISSLAEDRERTNALLDSLLTHAPLGFAFFDKNYRYQKLNEQLAHMNGISIADHVGKSLREVVPENAPDIEPIIDQIFATGKEVKEIEVSGETPKAPGVLRHWHCGFYPITDARGVVKMVGMVMIEITQRKDTEDQLRESEFRFRNLTDSSPMMIWVCNPDGSANWFNQPWLDFRQLSLEDALCEGCFANIHPDDEPWVQETRRVAFDAGEAFSVEFRTLSATGEYRWIHVKANPIVGDDGKPLSYLMSSLDVTDRINMEENLRRSLANERAARSDAEKANRMKDEFLAGLSHELRTPLTTMLGWTELLMKPKIREAELLDGLQVIQRSSKLQMQLINDLLDMSRISIGKINLEFEYSELFDTVQSVMDLVQTSAYEKNIDLGVREPADPIIVRMDPDRFSQIIWNLLSNAIKFTPSGGDVKVEVGVNADTAFVKVADSGIGIEESFLPYVFDRFRQADASRSRRHGGLGLGLAIAKQLAELHGGNIAVQSDGENQGCTFTVTIPIAEMSPLPQRSRVKTVTPEPLDDRRLVDVCVLLVEDDPSSRDVFRKILEIEGAVVIAADSATMARKLLRETSPDVIVSDIGMPEEDGYQLIRSIRSAGGELSDIPATALTAFASSEDRMRAFEAGFNSYLTKPVEPEELVKTVIELRTRDL